MLRPCALSRDTSLWLNINMQILLEDSALIAVAKDPGVSAVPGGWDESETNTLQVLEKQFGKLWIVHRLDRGTSGVLVFARNPEAHRALSVQFEERTVGKVYRAISNGVPSWGTRSTHRRLRVNVGHRHRTIIDDGGGLESWTDFAVLEQLGAACLLEAMPHTGRTHQVRAHAAALGLPLLGDQLYGGPATGLISRPALHAFQLTIDHPDTKGRLTVESPYPEDFSDALEKLRGAKR